MSDLTHLSAYVDFTSSMPLLELASFLSERLFAGIPFVGLDEGIWDEVPAVRLGEDFLRMRVELGGTPDDGYTLQVEPFGFPWQEEQIVVQVDFADYLRFLLMRLEGISVNTPD